MVFLFMNEYVFLCVEFFWEYMVRLVSVRFGMEIVCYEFSISYERVFFEDWGRDYYGVGVVGMVRLVSVWFGVESI